jgi:hypothetical protein
MISIFEKQYHYREIEIFFYIYYVNIIYIFKLAPI